MSKKDKSDDTPREGQPDEAAIKKERAKEKKNIDAEDEYQDVLESGPNLRGPLFWAGLLLIPIVLSLIVSLSGRSSQDSDLGAVAVEIEQTTEASTENAEPELVPRSEARTAILGLDNKAYDLDTARGRAAQRKAQAKGLATQTLGCNFYSWAGQVVDEALEEKLKALGRPYRLLEPGAVMTMDHNPARVNVQMDENDTITKVWCG